jgi:Antibiotic biosynthesis monooxygenase
MVARTVRMQLKPDSVAVFTRTLANAILPLLRQQPGFQDEMAFVVPGGTAALSSSVWDQQADAEAYARGTYPQVLQAVENVLEGTPQVDTYAVSNSTFHKIAVRVAV